MNQTSQPAGSADRHARWVAMWREAIRTSPLAIGLVELSTTRFLELSHRAAEVLRTTPERGAGLSYLSVTERPQEASQTFRLVRERMLDGIKGRRRFQRPDGSTVELQLMGWAIRSSSGPDLGLWMASGEPSEADDATIGGAVVYPALWSQTASDLDGAQITLDDHWRIADISTKAARVLGGPPDALLSCSIIELTHADDQAALLFAFARTTTDSSADVRIRLRHEDRGWRTIRAVLTMLEGDGSLPFSFVAVPVADADAPDSRGGASQLAGHLRRIAAQIEAAGILAPWIETTDALGLPTTSELSARQWEIASRLVGGERVATIAAELHVSPSTVRNHLSAIFQKFGVHSQAEFLALWRVGSKGAARPMDHRSGPD